MAYRNKIIRNVQLGQDISLKSIACPDDIGRQYHERGIFPHFFRLPEIDIGGEREKQQDK